MLRANSAPINKKLLMESVGTTIDTYPGRQAREQLFEEMYEQAFSQTARFVSRMGGTLPDAQDVFQDALLIFYEKTQDPGFALHSLPEAYILGIAKHLWVRKFRKDRERVSFSSSEQEILLPAADDRDVNESRLLAVLEKSGKRCLDLLRAFYYEKRPMRQIAGALGFAGDRSATVQKYKCLEKVRDTIKEKSWGYEEFLN
jgi:RNA polymerase sigma factor (sigma-70 family)